MFLRVLPQRAADDRHRARECNQACCAVVMPLLTVQLRRDGRKEAFVIGGPHVMRNRVSEDSLQVSRCLATRL